MFLQKTVQKWTESMCRQQWIHNFLHHGGRRVYWVYFKFRRAFVVSVRAAREIFCSFTRPCVSSALSPSPLTAERGLRLKLTGLHGERFRQKVSPGWPGFYDP